jgi:hypothetical protein
MEGDALTTIRIHNPEAPAPPPSVELDTLGKLRESRVGVLANTKQHAELVLNAIADQAGQRYGVIKELTGLRPATSKGDPAQLVQFSKVSDWVLTGSAD